MFRANGEDFRLFCRFLRGRRDLTFLRGILADIGCGSFLLPQLKDLQED